MAHGEGAVTRLWLQILGPIRVHLSGANINPGTRQQRLVLALLAARAGESVSVAELIELLWNEDPPASAVNIVHQNVGAVRRLLQPSLPRRSQGSWLAGDATGYRLAADTDSLDLARFRDLVGRGRAADGPDRALSYLVEALQLWRGPCAGARELLEREHPVFAAVDRECAEVARGAAELALQCNEVRSVLTVVRTVAAYHPLDEALQAELMLLLSADGKRAEAIGHYERVSAQLMNDLGADPGPELRQAHQTVLRRGVPVIAGESPRSRSEPENTFVPNDIIIPAQLPLDLPVFNGRDTVLRRIISLVNDHVQTQTSVPVLSLDGLPGIGKTTLAIHAAHQLADRYPDGQLYVDLQGFHPQGELLDPADVLHDFLGALNVREADIPASLHARAALFRSVLAGRRVMILLDNARDLQQVRPLLPGAPGCLVLVTSRNRLTGLATTYGAHMFTLQPLTPNEARQFLLSRMKPGADSGESRALDEIIERCAGLPLALAVVAGRASVSAGHGLSDIARALRDAQGRLDGFYGDDMGNDLRAIFSWSYQMLSEPAAQLFRLLSLQPGPEMTLSTIASLIGLLPPQSRSLLGELVRTRLLTEQGPHRYRAHDLVKAYSHELSLEYDSEEVRRDAVKRLFHHYWLTAEAAGSLIIPYRRRPESYVHCDRVTVAEASNVSDAVRWFDAEHHALRIVIQRAIDDGQTTLAWQTAGALLPFYQMRGGWDEWAATMTMCLDAVVAVGDKTGQIRIRRGLAGALSARGDYAAALQQLDDATLLAIEVGDRRSSAALHENIGEVNASRGDHRSALGHFEQAFRMFESLGDDLSCTHLLCYMAASRISLGEPENCAELVARAAPIFDKHGDTLGSGECQELLAESSRASGDLELSLSHWRRALDLYLGAGLSIRAARCWIGIGDTAFEQRDEAGAQRSWEEARTLLQGSGLAMLREAQDRLNRVGGPA